MPNSPLTLCVEGGVSIIKVDDRKANVFGLDMTRLSSAALEAIVHRRGAALIEGRTVPYCRASI